MKYAFACVVFMCLLVGCDSKDKAEASSKGKTDASIDPAEIQRQFVVTIEDTINKADPEMQKPVSVTTSEGDSTWSMSYKGKYKYDVQKTNSLVSPFMGTVSWEVTQYSDGKPIDIPVTLDATYAYQGGRWKIKSLVSTSRGESYPVDGYDKIFHYPED